MTTKITGGQVELPDASVTGAKLVANAVTPEKTEVGVLPSMVRVSTANGFGSTNTNVLRWTTVITNQGTDITYTDSATDGASFTINRNGIYSISFSRQSAANSSCGISLNYAGTMAAATFGTFLASQSASSNQNCSWTGYLTANDVIRLQADSGIVAAIYNTATIVRVA